MQRDEVNVKNFIRTSCNVDDIVATKLADANHLVREFTSATLPPPKELWALSVVSHNH